MGCCGGGVVDDKFSTFSDACYTGNLNKIKEALKKEGGSNPEKVVNKLGDDGFSGLHKAAQKGNAQVIQFLLESQGDPRQKSRTGETPLHIACFHRNKIAVVELLKTSAKEDVDVMDGHHGMTPLHMAVYRGAADITELLLKAGADSSIKDRYGQDSFELAKFWEQQEVAGMSSPAAEHKKTLAVINSKK